MASIPPERASEGRHTSGSFAFIRHGATDYNLRGLRCGGDVDIPLTEQGCETVFEMAHALMRRRLSFGVILCGSLIRTRQTALILSGVLGDLPIVTLAELNERRLGEWNGQSIKATEALLSADQTPPGGEGEGEFVARVSRALDEIRRHEAQRPLVVSSKGVGRVFHKLLGGQGRLAVENGELVVFRHRLGADGAASLDLERPLALR